MAIERTTPEPVVDMTTAQDAEEQEIVEIMEGIEEADIQMQDDGSAILGPEEEMMMNSEFGENLAEVVSSSELSKIYIDLMAAIESDRSSREDWEKTYTDGLKYLGMKFDETRSGPPAGNNSLYACAWN